MARTAKGQESIEQARRAIRQAKTVEQLRQAQSVVLPLDYGLSLKATAQVVGLSVGWVSRLRNAFIRGELIDNDATSTRGGRHHAHFTPEQEAELLEPFLDQVRTGGVLVASDIRLSLETALGRPIALSTVYNLLHRHGWRKLVSDKRYPKSDPQAQENRKKNSPK